MVNIDRISKLAKSIIKESEGKFNASYRIKSESKTKKWYNLNWNKHEKSLSKAFRCECRSWQIHSSIAGICKHTVALCKKLSDENRIPVNWFEKALKTI